MLTRTYQPVSTESVMNSVDHNDEEELPDDPRLLRSRGTDRNRSRRAESAVVSADKVQERVARYLAMRETTQSLSLMREVVDGLTQDEKRLVRAQILRITLGRDRLGSRER